MFNPVTEQKISIIEDFDDRGLCRLDLSGRDIERIENLNTGIYPQVLYLSEN